MFVPSISILDCVTSVRSRSCRIGKRLSLNIFAGKQHLYVILGALSSWCLKFRGNVVEITFFDYL